jgi:hypothetical protein
MHVDVRVAIGTERDLQGLTGPLLHETFDNACNNLRFLRAVVILTSLLGVVAAF